MSHSLPETLWENWNLSYTLTPTTAINTVPWYIPARATKSPYVQKWWSNLRPNQFIRTQLEKSPAQYDAAVVLRNPAASTSKINTNFLFHQLTNDGIKKVFVSADRYSTATFIFNQLLEHGFCPFMYEESVRLHSSDSEAGSHEHNLWSLVDWYSLLKAPALYKNAVRSTFTDFAEYMHKIPTKIVE